MFTITPSDLSTNLRFTSDKGSANAQIAEIVENQRKQLEDLREVVSGLRERLSETETSREEYKQASVALSKQLAESMMGHRRLHEEKDALFNEVCSLRRGRKDLRPLEQIETAIREDKTHVMFRIRPHAYQSEKVCGALREVWPGIRIPAVSEKDLQIICNVVDFVKFLLARDSWGASNSWKDLNVRFDKPRKLGPVHRIDLT